MLSGITLEELRRILSEALDKALDEPEKNMRRANQRLADLEQEDRQPRLATEIEVPSNTKAHKHMEDAAAIQANHGDSCSAKMVQVGPTSSTSFGMKAEPSALPSRDDVLVDKNAAAPKPCLSPVEMRTLTGTGDLLPPGKASTATRIVFYQLSFRFCLIEETNFRTTSIEYATYSNFWKMEVLETKSRQTLAFHPGGSTGRLRACPF